MVSRPGDMTVAVDSVSPSPGTACVGLVVVPVLAEASPKCFLLCRAAWTRSPRGLVSGVNVGGVSGSGVIKLIPETRWIMVTESITARRVNPMALDNME